MRDGNGNDAREGETSSTSATTTVSSAAAVAPGVFGRVVNLAGAAVSGISSRVKPGKVIAAARNAMEPARAIATVVTAHVIHRVVALRVATDARNDGG